MLELKNISFIRDNKKILNNINLKINTNKFIAITGPNGSGKSTLAKLISGILKVQQGKIVIDDLDLSKKEEHKEAVKKIGIVFQNSHEQFFLDTVEKEISFAVKHLNKSGLRELIIPETVTKIRPYAIHENNYLETLIIPGTITEIEEYGKRDYFYLESLLQSME